MHVVKEINASIKHLQTQILEIQRTIQGNINPHAIKAMKEVGIDISKQRPKIITEDMIRQSAARVNMGCIQRESCPTHIREDFLSGIHSGVNGTPTFYINELRYNDSWDFEILVERLKSAI
ncbi:MAG: thioredoxin domain-containing protein [Candidatus Nitrosopolaris sp.]